MGIGFSGVIMININQYLPSSQGVTQGWKTIVEREPKFFQCQQALLAVAVGAHCESPQCC